MSTSVAIVIPTRNRADLAIEAIRSLLAISDARLLRVIVSNNSSEPGQVRQLADFCERSADARLLHVRPAQSLPMAEHWDWAIEQALDRTDATHLALHYDRRVSTPSFGHLLELTDAFPEMAITYLLDLVYPVPPRFRVHQMPWSGGLYEIRTSRALRLASQGLLTDLWQVFPVLVNCVTPRSVFERVRERFGTFCASTSPESCFGFRFSALEERYLHFDMPLGIHYASARSNGMSYLRGETSGTFGDFVRLFGERPWLDAAPLPGVSLGQNVFYHEYARVQRDAGPEKFPPVEMDGYLKDLARGLAWIDDPVRRSAMRDLLASHGWQEQEGTAAATTPDRPRLADRLRQKVSMLRADYLYARPGDLSGPGFAREARALHYARRDPRPPVQENDFLAPLQPVRHERA